MTLGNMRELGVRRLVASCLWSSLRFAIAIFSGDDGCKFCIRQFAQGLNALTTSPAIGGAISGAAL